jgi:aminoglycoside phosphotransferase (APT) family kinase protein
MFTAMSDDIGTEPAIDRAALATWLQSRLGGVDAVEIDEFSPPRSGYSAETTVFTARVTRDGSSSPEKYVVRRETPEPPVYPAQSDLDVEIEIQYRVMDAVASHSSVPLAPLVGFEKDPAVLGAPFFVMGYVEGEVPIESPIYTQEGFFVDAAPDQRREMLFDGLRIMSDIHKIDWRAAGLEWLAPAGIEPGTARQMDVWEQYCRHGLGDRVHPLFDEGMAWLRANVPPQPELCLSWGDPRPGNVIWRDFRGVCVTDFEAASIAPPEYDLGWWLMFDHWSHETMGVDRLPGEPTRDEQRDHYAACLGRDVGDTIFYEVFAAVRYTAIVVRVMNRMVERGMLPPDQTIWLDNPATVCLDLMLPR